MRGLNLLAKHSSRFLVHQVHTVRGNWPGVFSGSEDEPQLIILWDATKGTS